MSETDDALRALHVDGWAVLRPPGRLDEGSAAVVRAALGAELAAGTPVALDLRHHGADPDTVAGLWEGFAAPDGPGFAVVAHDPEVRAALAEAGVEAHESLDAAVGDSAPALRRASDGAGPAALAPAAGDAITTTARHIAHFDPSG